MQIKRRLFTILTLLASAPSAVWAGYSYGPVSFSAFGTLAGSWLSNDDVDYGQSIQPVGPGGTHDFDIGLDSRLGAQINIAVTPQTLITAQAVVERLPNNEFGPRLTQANIRQEISENFALRIGRVQSPVFLASEYRLANFSNPWVRTPGVLYSIYGLTHIDSADFTYRIDSAIGQFSLNAGYGWLSYPFPTGFRGASTTTLDADDVVFANLKLDQAPWNFKLSWLYGHATTSYPQLDNSIKQLAFFDPSAAKSLPVNYLGVSLYTAGFSYDSADWLVMAEWGMGVLDRASFFSDLHGGYLTVGYHFDRWMPHLTIGYRVTSDRRVESNNPLVDAQIARQHQLQRSNYQTLAAGLNYTVTDSMILRGQVDLIAPEHHSHGPYINTTPGYRFEDPAVDALFSLSLDFVY